MPVFGQGYGVRAVTETHRCSLLPVVIQYSKQLKFTILCLRFFYKIEGLYFLSYVWQYRCHGYWSERAPYAGFTALFEKHSTAG